MGDKLTLTGFLATEMAALFAFVRDYRARQAQEPERFESLMQRDGWSIHYEVFRAGFHRDGDDNGSGSSARG